MSVRLVLAFAVAGASAQAWGQAGAITLVNPEGRETRCSAPATREDAAALMREMPPPKDFGAFGALTAAYNMRRISLLEYCARRYELAGYSRRLQADPAAGQSQTFTNPVFPWSVSYPAGWKVDPNPSFVRITAPDGGALCGIHSTEVRYKSLQEHVEFGRTSSEKYFRQQGVTLWSSDSRPLALPNGVAGVEVITEMSNGGRSRRVYAFAEPVGYLIDCETHTGAWEKLEPVFARIIASLTFARKP